jgi:multidrug efflux pump subunit AcrA (membrane-fusion protein)
MAIKNTGAASAPRSSGGRGKRVLTIFLTVLGACLLLFFGGFFVGRSGLTAARAELEKTKADSAKQVSQAKAESQQIQAQLQSEQARTEAFTQVAAARNWLYRSAVQLDRRNFGMAQTDLKQASDLLGSAKMEAAGFSAVQSQAVRTTLQGINLTVSEDTGAARGQILQAAEQLDAMFDALTPAASPDTKEAP